MEDGGAVETLLRTTAIFGALEDEDRAQCARAFRQAHFEAGRMLFAQGDPGGRAYLVVKGLVRLAITTASGRELSVRIAGPGDLIGEIAVFDGAPRSADATALTGVEAFTIAAGDFDRLFEANPKLARAVVHYLCGRLRATTDQLENIALHTIEVRLARFLLNMIGPREADPKRRLPLELGYSQGELARLLGSSRPRLNMALGTLEQAGAIKRTSDRLFCDPALLTELAEADHD